MNGQCTIGIDFGTSAVRAIVTKCANGREIGAASFDYPTGTQGVILDPSNHSLARQNPADYIAGLETVVKGALAAALPEPDFSPIDIIAIGVDATGSTPLPVDKQNRPLALLDPFQSHPAAQAWLWKDHTAVDKAERISEIARINRPQYIEKYGGTYSSEWFWSKIWHCLDSTPDVFAAAFSWVELADFVPSLLAGIDDPLRIKRGICAAGHKGMYNEQWGGLPDKEFLAMLDPALADLRDRLFQTAYPANVPAGFLCPDWAEKCGLPGGIPIAIGALDAHQGAIGAGVGAGVLVKIIGTSTCDIAVQPASVPLEDIPGICGTVNGSVLPGYYGLEAGQSAVGDVFKWFVEVICRGDEALHQTLTVEASELSPGESGLLALDWNNGNRTVLVDPRLTGLLVGQTLYTTRAEIYRALIEATAFGARVIIERLESFGVVIGKIVCCGGIAEKNPLLMQIYADIAGRIMQVSAAVETCALGSAVSAAVVAGKKAGGYDSFEEAQQRMVPANPVEYHPIPENSGVYDRLFRTYQQLHDSFGGAGENGDISRVMKTLLEIKDSAAIRKGSA